MIVSLKNGKEIIVPDLFKEFISDSTSLKIYNDKSIQNLNKISKEIKNGHFILIEQASQKDIIKLYDFVERKIDEFISHDQRSEIKSKDNNRNKKYLFETKKKNVLNHILIVGKNEKIITYDDGTEINDLIYFCGSTIKHNDKNFIIPFKFYRDLQNKLSESIFVEAVGNEFRTGINVLLPKSQETYNLFKKSISGVSKKCNLSVLDMGCGSGVLSYILYDQLVRSEIYFTDILPESIASSELNLRKLQDDKEGKNKLINLNPGYLFNNIDKNFDLIVFNPPWIDARANNRSELALNDKDQTLLVEFLLQSGDHLKDNGRILLGFSDNSGEKAIENFEKNIADHNFKIIKVNSDRIQSYQSGRKWMKIFVYELMKII
ncbi:MAG: class I SAM-dependent methyltransferase [Candidatus Delongbacteria bacterium]|nr:class I SAM-dependent methyltransferase [Candidatus Delongbacteria bacterium]